jgi:hypothetical protein
MIKSSDRANSEPESNRQLVRVSRRARDRDREKADVRAVRLTADSKRL